MRVLIGCERSGVVREAFRKRGHDAWSCDLVPAEDKSRYHIQGDLRTVLPMSNMWDMMIAFPDCTYLCNSGALRLYTGGKKINGPDSKRWEQMYKAAYFFKEILNTPIPKVCVENPIMHGYAREIIGARPTQTIQPYNFGADASKRTGLWLRGLPELVNTAYVEPRMVDGKPRWANQTDGGWNKLAPSPTRGIERARTYQGIAEAMAEQWG